MTEIVDVADAVLVLRAKRLLAWSGAIAEIDWFSGDGIPER